jgi:arylsulfatase
VRDGKWKLVAKNGQPWELYDMNADRTEMNNLTQKHPDRVKEMAAQWDAWAAQSKVLPLGTWKIEPDPPTKRRVFELKQGDELLRDMCPVVRERTVIITAEILEHGKDGVIIAQGGLAHGYSLYMKEGKLYFAIRRDNKLTTIKAQEPLPPAPVSVDAIIEKNGAIRLAQGGKTLAFSPSGGPLMITPIDGLSVGWDMGHPVGNYKGAFLFKGKIKKVIVDTRQKKSQ